MYTLISYVELAPEGVSILKDKVSRIFPTDESEIQEPGKHVSKLPIKYLHIECLGMHHIKTQGVSRGGPLYCQDVTPHSMC